MGVLNGGGGGIGDAEEAPPGALAEPTAWSGVAGRALSATREDIFKNLRGDQPRLSGNTPPPPSSSSATLE